MKYQQGLIHHRLSDSPVIIALGAFDGVHCGHQYLLSCGRKLADDHHALLAVLTFSSLPRMLLAPEEPSYALTSSVHKRQLLEGAGVDILIEVPFSKELMAMEASDFLQTVESMVTIDTWIGGRDLRFGRGGAGNCSFLEKRSEYTGMKTLFFERISASEEIVSSSRIRALVMSGAFSEVHALLGRPYSFMAPCLSSGRAVFLLDTSALCLPSDGVYGATVAAAEWRASVDAVLCLHHDDRLPSLCEVIVDVATLPAIDFLEVTPRIFLSPSKRDLLVQ